MYTSTPSQQSNSCLSSLLSLAPTPQKTLLPRSRPASLPTTPYSLLYNYTTTTTSTPYTHTNAHAHRLCSIPIPSSIPLIAPQPSFLHPRIHTTYYYTHYCTLPIPSISHHPPPSLSQFQNSKTTPEYTIINIFKLNSLLIRAS